ncbi:FeoB small GTPase domain-containing protein [Desulfotruncus alcoholivorax]|uniref:FeoB small GTPase domain-containing protein n=1 Tax=Desulfotruncus alcoholivorax TaxID=265477 RepID=UPI0004007CBD|nr:FeoB small GTPase domain-containing protein [Desulfotruncus alcoholivorax]
MLKKFKKRSKCCGGEQNPLEFHGLKKIVLVGNPNVGKSVLFNRLTGAYVTVSNYPGTTVEVSRGRGKIGDEYFEVVDTPGMYSLLPITEEEAVSRRLLLNEHPEAVVHVVDAKNIQRMLPLTLQLIESGLPVILVLNMMDEAKKLGLEIDLPGLEKSLGIPVISAVFIKGTGIEELKRVIKENARLIS